VQEDGHVLLVEEALLDDEERERVMTRCSAVVAAGAIPPLVWLCAGPEGPLVDRSDPFYVPPKAVKKGKKKGAKAKQEPGVHGVYPISFVMRGPSKCALHCMYGETHCGALAWRLELVVIQGVQEQVAPRCHDRPCCALDARGPSGTFSG
jgi:hypothetical protein